MSNREAVPDAQKDVQWRRDMEDRLKALETRKVQGDLTMDSLAINGNLSFPGTSEALTAESVALGNDPMFALCNTAVTLTTALQDLPGMEVTPTQPGYYVYFFFVDILFSASGNATAIAQAAVSGGSQGGSQALLLDASGGPLIRATVGGMGVWNLPDITGAPSLKIQAVKNAAAATISIQVFSPLLVLRTGAAR